MRFLKNLSIRSKQNLIITLTTGVVLFLACVAFVGYDIVAFRKELVENLSALTGAIGNNCAAAIDFNDPKSAEETLAALRANNNIVSACVYSSDGKLFAFYRRDAGAFVAPPVSEIAREDFTADELRLFRPIKQRNEKIGTIFVASDLNDLRPRLVRFIEIVSVVFLASLALALLLSSLLQRLISGPI